MFLIDFRGLVNKDGLLGFKSYLSMILNEIIEGKNREMATRSETFGNLRNGKLIKVIVKIE